MTTGTFEAVTVKVKHFTIEDTGYAKYFLGEIALSSDSTYINHHKYASNFLKDTGLLRAKPALTPIPKGVNLVLTDQCC